MDDLFVNALLAGLTIAAVAGPLGVFVVWRRSAYFGDTLGHSALLGVAVGIALGIDTDFSVLAVATIAAAALSLLGRRTGLGSDTVLGIVAHGGLALGVVGLALTRAPAVDFSAYLFGDILALAPEDVLNTILTAVIVLATLALIWRRLLSATLSEELAGVEGVPVFLVGTVFMVLLAWTVAIAMKAVGILLVTALLIIPAAAARPLARTPRGMAVLAVVAGMVAVVLGLQAAFTFDTPAGPTIVVAALVLFVLSAVTGALKPR
ncbi:MAG: hypothetical protein FJX42_12130 [Alphaproteobacteria bacterium]|nr:hypothetical protein [Alphaproteobacteria bacterium]